MFIVRKCIYSPASLTYLFPEIVIVLSSTMMSSIPLSHNKILPSLTIQGPFAVWSPACTTKVLLGPNVKILVSSFSATHSPHTMTSNLFISSSVTFRFSINCTGSTSTSTTSIFWSLAPHHASIIPSPSRAILRVTFFILYIIQ